MTRKIFLAFLIYPAMLVLHACNTIEFSQTNTTSSSDETDSLRYRYIQQISRKIEIIGVTRYPNLGKEITVKSQIEVELIISANGKLQRVRLLRASNNPQLDNKILEIVRYSAPYPPLPDELNLERMIVNKHWQFRPSE